MSEVLEKITKGESYTGQACVYCGERIQAEDEVVVCPRCKSVHHADCWKKERRLRQTGLCPDCQGSCGEKIQRRWASAAHVEKDNPCYCRCLHPDCGSFPVLAQTA